MSNVIYYNAFQTAVFRIADKRGDGAETRAAGSAEKVRMRHAAVFRHSRLQRLLCRSRGLERRHENRSNAQPALHGFRRAHRPEKKPKRLQGTLGRGIKIKTPPLAVTTPILNR